MIGSWVEWDTVVAGVVGSWFVRRTVAVVERRRIVDEIERGT